MINDNMNLSIILPQHHITTAFVELTINDVVAKRIP